MNIQKYIGSVFVTAVVGITYYATLQLGFAKDLATVNGRAITDHDLTQALGALNERQKEGFLKDLSSKELILQGLIDQEVIYQEAEKLKLDRDPDINYAVSNFKKQLIMARLLDKKLNVQISQATLMKYFKAHKDM